MFKKNMYYIINKNHIKNVYTQYNIYKLTIYLEK